MFWTGWASLAPLETAEHAYVELQRREAAARTAVVTFVNDDGNAWTHEHTYLFLRPHKLAAHGYGMNYRTDGRRTFESDDSGDFNRAYQTGDVWYLPGFEAFADQPPKVTAEGNFESRKLNGIEMLAIKIDSDGNKLLLYLNPKTRLPSGYQAL